MKEHVKILLLGDEGVGKSSLLSAYMSKHFPQEVPPVVIDTTIPAEKTANGVCVTIMDSSARHREQLKQKILAADSIVALYDVTRPETYENLLSDWLPFIKEVLSIPDVIYPPQSLSNGNSTSNLISALAQPSSLVSKTKTVVNDIVSPPNTTTNILGNQSNSTSMNKLNILATSGTSSASKVNATANVNVIAPSSSSTSTSQKNKPVIVLATKTDLLVSNNEDEEAEKVHSLFDLFPFVLLCLRCSAAKLEDVEQLFYFAELLVTFPLAPIFDVVTHEYTPACRYAFQRIFRIFDLDGDNLLSDSELCESQLKCFDLAINHEELLAIKRQISKMVPGGIYQDKVTFEGYLGLIQMIIENHQLQIPWTILRRFHYNEELQLQIPKEILTPPPVKDDQITELSAQAKVFLFNLAKVAYLENTKPMKPDSDSCSEMEDCLTWEALKTILCVLPIGSNHPWSFPPHYKSLWPRNNDPVKPIEQSILLTGMPHSGATISFECWLTHWNQLAVSDPLLVQKLLFELGYAERQDLGIIVSASTIEKLHKTFIEKRHSSLNWFNQVFSFLHRSPSDITSNSLKKNLLENMSRSIVHIAIFGDNRVGKSTFVWNISSLRPPGFDEEDVEKSADYEKPLENIVIGGCTQNKSAHPFQYANGTNFSSGALLGLSKSSTPGTPAAAQSYSMYEAPYINKQYDLCFAAIPLDHTEKWNEVSVHRCDLVVLMFQCGDMESLETVLQLEKGLPPRTPRIFIGTKADLLLNQSFVENQLMIAGDSHSIAQHMRDLRQAHEMVLQTVTLHTQEEELPPVILTSSASNVGVQETLALVRTIIHDPTIAIPVNNRKVNNTNYHTPIVVASGIVGIASASFLLIRYNQEMKSVFNSFINAANGIWSTWLAIGAGVVHENLPKLSSWINIFKMQVQN